MSAPKRWLNERGASVLAALVLVAVLGAVFLVLQYARTSGSFAYNSAALTAATAAAVGSTLPPGCTSTTVNGQTQYQCNCSQNAADKQHQVTAGGDSTKLTQCLDGCNYTITPASPYAQITSSGQTTSIQTGDCHATVCTAGYPPTCAASTVIGSASISDIISNANAQNVSNAQIPQTPETGGTASAFGGETQPSANAGAPCSIGTLSGTYAADGVTCNVGSNNQGSGPVGSGNAGASDQGSSLTNTAYEPPNPNPTCDGDTGCTCPSGYNYSNGSCSSSQAYCQQNPNSSICQNQDSLAPTPPTKPCDLGSTSNNCTQQQPAGNTPSGVPNNGGGPGNTFGQQQQPQPCPAGTTGTPGNCISITPGLGGNNGILVVSAGGLCQQNNGNVLTSFITGLAQGVSGAVSGYSCAGNSMMYGNYNQIACGYQQQPMQYCPYGCNGYACATSPQISSPYGTGTNGAACGQPPPQPDPSQCTTGTWQPTSATGNGCTTNWQCVPTNGNGQQPIPSLSCNPQTADVGSTISISYSCGAATDSTGSGFVTDHQLSGSTTTVVAAPPAGDNTATYGLTCYNGSATAGAQCAVQINQPSIVLVANPSSVASGGTTAVGWVTSGMQSCVASSPTDSAFTSANANNTSVNGMAQTSPITQSTKYVLTCTTLGGNTLKAHTTVDIGGNASSTSPITVSSNVDGSTVAHGGTVSITWSSTNPPSGSTMSLWLVNELTGQANTVIVGGQALSGTYTWNVPAVGATCNANAANVCASDLVSGDQYAIEAVLYTPSDAYVGDGSEPANPVQPTYGASAVTTPFTLDDSSTQATD